MFETTIIIDEPLDQSAVVELCKAAVDRQGRVGEDYRPAIATEGLDLQA
ncbi:MAG: hypothetical protein P1V81_16900 [Planctomycetota bacterium]|nr:hypothetical protein [Planctomycetota bacterium]